MCQDGLADVYLFVTPRCFVRSSHQVSLDKLIRDNRVMTEVVNSPVLDRAHPLYDKYVETQGFSHPSSIVLRILEGKRNVGQTTEHVLHIEVRDSVARLPHEESTSDHFLSIYVF
jgi:hypothetical protein